MLIQTPKTHSSAPKGIQFVANSTPYRHKMGPPQPNTDKDP